MGCRPVFRATISERNLAVVLTDFRKVTAVIRRRIASGGRAIGGAARRTVARPLLGVASLRSITTLRITAAVAVACLLAWQKRPFVVVILAAAATAAGRRALGVA